MKNVRQVTLYATLVLVGGGLSDALAKERTLAEIAQGKALAAFSACQSNSQCVVVWGGCADVAINKKHVPLMQVPQGSCSTVLPHNPKVIARCSIYGRCVIAIAPKTREYGK